jgi:uncharacterized protein YfdQ (DUF2303 family)
MSSEAIDVANIALEGADPHELERGSLILVADGDGKQRVVDLDDYADNPRVTKAGRVLRDAASFVRYVEKHGSADRTEVYADRDASSVVAVIDSHLREDATKDRAGRQAHRATLQLRHTPAWEAWVKNQGQKSQTDFAEFVEEHALEFVEPEAATMLEIAQTFQVKRGVEFSSATRLSSGEVTIAYGETDKTKAGQKGELSFPERFKVALQPYQGGEPYVVTALLRYRLNEGRLTLGYTLLRLDVVLEDAFKDVLNEVDESLEKAQIPLFYGKTA